jgi:nucleoside-diphosphate-sugar epimerase
MHTAGELELAYRVLRFKGEPPVTRFGISVFAYSKTFDVGKAVRVLGPCAVSLEEGTDRFVRWQRDQA